MQHIVGERARAFVLRALTFTQNITVCAVPDSAVTKLKFPQ